MFGGELAGQFQHPSPVKRHTGFQRQVVAQHEAHADRVGLVVGNAEIEHRPAERGGLDGVAQGRHLMADGLDDDVGAVGAGRVD